MPGGTKTRVSARLLLRLFRGGFTAVENLSRWAGQKQVLDHPAVRNLFVIAAAWGTTRAFDDVRSRDDWKKPSDKETSKDWKSRVNWSVLEAIDAVGADADKLEIPELEDELRRKFKDKALIDKTQPSSSTDALASDGLLAPTSI